MQIVYCMMTQNRLPETRACIERSLPYVDHVIVVDGGSIDDSIFYFRNWSQQESKLQFFIHPWTDNFSAQRNNYIAHAHDICTQGDFILVSDPDELFEEATFAGLRELGEKMNKVNTVNAAGFQCRSVSLKGPERVWENLDDYHKHLFYKYDPTMHYTGNPHETLVLPGGLRIVNTDLIYEHIKQENVIWHRGMRNFFIGGGGPNLGSRNKIWVEFLQLLKDCGLSHNWHSFDKYLLQGNIDQRIKDWMIKYHNIDGFDGSSEVREVYKTYFRFYHPEEEPPFLTQVHIP